MYLFQVFRSFLPLRNPLGFGAIDFVVLALAVLLAGLLVLTVWVAPFARELAKRRRLCMCFLFGFAVVLRIALLPRNRAPIPGGAEDFSSVLLGDTLSHLRLANVTHPLSQFFETVLVLQQPAYASVYPLGQGLFLALGTLVFRSPWAGVLVSDGIFCALCYWMLRAWVAPIWALLGGLLAVMQFGPLSSWVNSYWGGAFVAASAGCLVFGSLPRLRESPCMRYGVLLGTGLGLQLLTQPFEAAFLLLAATVYLFATFRRNPASLRKPALVAAGVLTAALGLMLLQNKAITQSWTTTPTALGRYEYGVPPALTFEPSPVPHNRLTAAQKMQYMTGDSVPAYFHRLIYRLRNLRFFFLAPLYFGVLALLLKLRRANLMWAAGTVLLFALGTNLHPDFVPGYVAAVSCIFVLFSVRGMEALGERARIYVWLLCCAFFVFWYGIYLSGNNDLLPITAYQCWFSINSGDPQGRRALQAKLDGAPGEQLVFVRESPFREPGVWVHNAAEIDAARTVWANDLGEEENEKLLRYYPRRKAWLLEQDRHPPALVPYPGDSSKFLTVH